MRGPWGFPVVSGIEPVAIANHSINSENNSFGVNRSHFRWHHNQGNDHTYRTDC